MNAFDILQYGDLTFVRTVQAVPLCEREVAGVCGHWSVKDIITHLASFEILLTDVFSILLDKGPTPVLDQWLTDQAAFNDFQVNLRNHQTARGALIEYLEAHNGVMSLAAEIPEEVWRQPGTLPWRGGQYSLDDFVVYQIYGHKREHSAQIATFLEKVTQTAQT
jgi:hypothetical protein